MITAWSILVYAPDPTVERPLNMIYVAALPTAEAAEKAVLAMRHNIQGESAEAIAVLNKDTVERLGLRSGEVRIL